MKLRHPVLLLLLAVLPLLAQPRQPRTAFEVTYIVADVLHIDGGSDEGLAEGMELEVTRLGPGQPQMAADTVGRVRVRATSPQSAVCEVLIDLQGIEKGDLASLSAGDAEKVAYLVTSKNSHNYPQIISFAEMLEQNPLEADQRAYVPRPTLAEANRVRGRISVQRSSLFDDTTLVTSTQAGASQVRTPTPVAVEVPIGPTQTVHVGANRAVPTFRRNLDSLGRRLR